MSALHTLITIHTCHVHVTYFAILIQIKGMKLQSCIRPWKFLNENNDFSFWTETKSSWPSGYLVLLSTGIIEFTVHLPTHWLLPSGTFASEDEQYQQCIRISVMVLINWKDVKPWVIIHVRIFTHVNLWYNLLIIANLEWFGVSFFNNFKCSSHLTSSLPWSCHISYLIPESQDCHIRGYPRHMQRIYSTHAKIQH
jgi:hypothetical protein